jgi:hypothetical protein
MVLRLPEASQENPGPAAAAWPPPGPRSAMRMVLTRVSSADESGRRAVL